MPLCPGDFPLFLMHKCSHHPHCRPLLLAVWFATRGGHQNGENNPLGLARSVTRVACYSPNGKLEAVHIRHAENYILTRIPVARLEMFIQTRMVLF